MILSGRAKQMATYLIVVGERDDTRADTQNHTRVNLHVRKVLRPIRTLYPSSRIEILHVTSCRSPLYQFFFTRGRTGIIQIIRRHSDKDRFLFCRIDILDNPFVEELRPCLTFCACSFPVRLHQRLYPIDM